MGWGFRLHWLHFFREDPRNEWPRYDTKQFNEEAPVMLELWKMLSTSALPSLLNPLWPRVVAPERYLSMGQIEQNCVLILNRIVWNRTVNIYKMDLALNNLQWLVWHKTKQNKTKPRPWYANRSKVKTQFLRNIIKDNYILLFSFVRLWTIRCLLVQVSYARTERIWQSSVIINSLTGKRAGHTVGVNWVGGWRHGRKGFRILKKTGVEVRPSKGAV